MLEPDKTHFFSLDKICHFVNLYLNSSSKFKLRIEFKPALVTNAQFNKYIMFAILFHYF